MKASCGVRFSFVLLCAGLLPSCVGAYGTPVRYQTYPQSPQYGGFRPPAPAYVRRPDQPVGGASLNRSAWFNDLASVAGIAAPEVTEEQASISGDASPVTVLRVVFDETAFFSFDSAVVSTDSGRIFDLVAQSMVRDAPDTQLTLLGHTDAIGSDRYNEGLALRRAQTVFQALASRGANPARLSTVAIGKRQPIASNETEAGRARNRRVEFLLSSSLDANLSIVRRVAVNAALLRTGPGDGPAQSTGPVRLAVMRPEQAQFSGQQPSLLQTDQIELQPVLPVAAAARPAAAPVRAVPTAIQPAANPSLAEPVVLRPEPERQPDRVSVPEVERAPLGPERTY